MDVDAVYYPVPETGLALAYLSHEIDAQDGNRRDARLRLAHGGITHDERVGHHYMLPVHRREQALQLGVHVEVGHDYEGEGVRG